MFRILLFGLALLLLAGGIYTQGNNKREASRRVQAILTADLAGKDVKSDIDSTHKYVANHMGATIDFTLTGSYNRAQVAAAAYQDAFQKAQQANSQIYAEAQQACSGQTDSLTQARCNQQYLNSHLQNIQLPDPVLEPDQNDYYYKLVSPPWTPDVAGSLYFDSAATLVLAAGLAIAVPWRRRRR